MNTDWLWEMYWGVPLRRSKNEWAVDENGPELCGVTGSLFRSFESSWSTRDVQWLYSVTLRQPGVSAGLSRPVRWYYKHARSVVIRIPRS